MSDEDYGSTASLKRYAPGLAWLPRAIRERLTPTALWSVIAGTGTLLVIAASSWVTTQKNIAHLQELVSQQQAHEQRADELLQQLVTGQAVMNSTMSDFRDEQDRQREWRDRLADIAEAPPHARRRPK